MGELWGQIRERAGQIFGELSADIRFGGGEPTSGRIRVGERAAPVWGTLIIFLLAGMLLALIIRKG